LNILLKQAGYQLNEELKIWSRPDYSSINYSDGDSTELRIKFLIDQARDVSVFSDELRKSCTDWPSLYYLSSTRSNLLRIFDADLSGSILEIGAGCGAITRYLGEQGGEVLALEGSSRRASIARSRTRDLPNVSILAESFEAFCIDTKFDVITLIGVFEYSNLFISGDNPGARMLQKVRSLLKPDGLLIIAIENQLGLKYFAGAPEDHVVTPMFGVEGRYTNLTPQTYGKQALISLLAEAGFESNEFFAPFPDYKLPVSIVTEEGFNEPGFDASAFAWQSVQRDPQLPEFCTFSLELAWPQIVKNGLGMDMSNSFLIGASPVLRKTLDAGTLAFHYSSDRRSIYCKCLEFRKNSLNTINVHYKKIGKEDQFESNDQSVVEFNLIESEPYINGFVLSKKLIDIVNTEGWTYVDVSDFLKGYVAILNEISGGFQSISGMLIGELIDAVPQNIVIDESGLPSLIDKEWSLTTTFRLEFLLFRTLIQLLGSTSRFNKSSEPGPITNKEFIFAACDAAGYPIDDADVKEFLLLESSIQNAINGRSPSEFLTWDTDKIIVEDNLYSAFNKSQVAVESLESMASQTLNDLVSTAEALSRAGLEVESLTTELAERNSAYNSLIKALEESMLSDANHTAQATRALNELKLTAQAVSVAELEIDRLSTELAERESTYNSLINSKSWLITKPLRYLFRSLRNAKGIFRNNLELSKRAATSYLRDLKPETSTPLSDDHILESPIERLRSVSVILPIYKDVEMTKRCILAAIPGITSFSNSKLVAINDASPDSGMHEMLLELQQKWPEVLTVLENEVNLGFVKTVNRGMLHDPQNDVVFLNSDVIVPINWLERLTAEAYISKNIGTVTPFSNNATICSFPAFLFENTAAFGLSVAQIDSVFAAPRLPNIQAPTGVGFCMYVRRDCLDVIGLLNEEKFGRGYGEENDLCQRALKAGWLNIITPNLYAFHEGGVSFSSSKQALTEHASKAIEELHPEYHLDIQRFIAADPLKLVRVKRLVQLISTLDRPKILQISHEAGGGVQQHLDELAESIEPNACCLFLAPHRGSGAITLRMGNFPGADVLTFRLPEELSLLVTFLKGCGINFVHFHHSLGLNKALLELPAHLGTEYALTVHDYYWLCGNPTLTNAQGVYPGEYVDDIANPHFPLDEGVTPALWRDQLRGFIENAKTIVFPSEYTLSIYNEYYSLPNPIVAAHVEEKRAITPVALTVPQKHHYNVGIIGALGKEKGADYLEQIADIAARVNAPLNFRLIGFAYRELRGVLTTGRYDSHHLGALIVESKFDLILFPSQCPETYSYTLSYALETSLPIIAPDIGAFPERLSGRENTLLYKYGIDPAMLVAEIQLFVEKIVSGVRVAAPQHANSLLDPTFYTSTYTSMCGSNVSVAHQPRSVVELPGFEVLSTTVETTLTTKEIILLALWTLYRNPHMQRLSNALPYGVRQKIKRVLTRRPLHEIVDVNKR
jgi:GT2 family glycosyltransferase/2-polyprenyl-3-methyl-5-hydroxy-6-metoxy-1,4-benzoquinol methylase/glycosyltransferase involved in cell wall biosynthesis